MMGRFTEALHKSRNLAIVDANFSRRIPDAREVNRAIADVEFALNSLRNVLMAQAIARANDPVLEQGWPAENVS
jgi:hypothetical protein